MNTLEVGHHGPLSVRYAACHSVKSWQNLEKWERFSQSEKNYKPEDRLGNVNDDLEVNTTMTGKLLHGRGLPGVAVLACRQKSKV